MAEGNGKMSWVTAQVPEAKTRQPAEDRDFVQVNGEEHPPLYIRAGAIEAVGVYGTNDSLVVLCSGKEIVARGTTPAEVVGLLAEEEDQV